MLHLSLMTWAWIPSQTNSKGKSKCKGKGNLPGSPGGAQKGKAKGGTKTDLQRKEHKCGRCGIHGHYDKECPLLINGTVCSKCGLKGHDHKMCTTPAHKIKAQQATTVDQAVTRTPNGQTVDKNGPIWRCPNEKCKKDNQGLKNLVASAITNCQNRVTRSWKCQPL